MCADLEVIDDNVVEMDEESLTLSLSADDPSVTTTTITSATVVIRENCLLYTSPSPRDATLSRMPSSA